MTKLACFACSFAATLPKHDAPKWRAESSQVATNVSHRRRKGGMTPEVIRQRRQARERHPNAKTTSDTVVATWAGVELARSSKCEFLDGRFFFPESSVRWEYLSPTDVEKTHNPIGKAVYYDIRAPANGGAGKPCVNRHAAFCYRDLRKQWRIMEGRTAFWKGVAVTALTRDKCFTSHAEGE